MMDKMDKNFNRVTASKSVWYFTWDYCLWNWSILPLSTSQKKWRLITFIQSRIQLGPFLQSQGSVYLWLPHVLGTQPSRSGSWDAAPGGSCSLISVFTTVWDWGTFCFTFQIFQMRPLAFNLPSYTASQFSKRVEGKTGYVPIFVFPAL